MIARTGFASLFTLAALAAASPSSAQDAPQPERAAMTARDLVTMPRLGAPVAMPGGEETFYTVTETDLGPAEAQRTQRYFLRSLTDMGAPPRELAFPKGASSVVPGPDGAFWYLAEGQPVDDTAVGYTALWRVTHSGGALGTPKQVTMFAGDVSGFVLSPNASRVALYGEVPRNCQRLDCDGTPDDVVASRSDGSGRLYQSDGGFVRHWDTWEEVGRTSRVFAYTLGADGTLDPASATPVDGPIGGTELLAGDTPVKPFGGNEDIAWAPDGSALYFVARQGGAGEPYSTNTDIYRSALDGGAPANLTQANQAMDALPTPSPDGRWLAYTAMERPGYESDRMVIHLRDLASGQVRALTEGFDRSFGSLAWTPDSRWLVATAQDVLDTPAFRIDPRSGAVGKLDLMAGNEAHIGNVAPLAGDRLLFTRDSIGAPAEIYLSENWGQAEPLTEVTSTRVGALAPITVRRFSFTGAGGDTVWGQITRLENQTGPIPAILYVHGGPQGSFNDGWSSRWNPRVVASQGYAVISVDFHGSTGYGQEFTDSIRRDWGGKPLEDLQLGLAAALELDDQIDGSRACAMGASYGGYMMNWIAGNWPDRFKCLVQHDGLFDMRSFYYTTEELWFPKWDFGGSYAENSALYERWNPVNYVENWRTPMLVVTGEKDFRVPYTQGIASFTALQERGIPGELLVFPDENHWVLGPKNSLQWHETVFSWLDRWLGEQAQ